MNRSDWLVERVHLGEATPEEQAELRKDPRLMKRLEELAAADAAFHADHPAEEQLAAIRRKVHLADTRDAIRRRRTFGAVALFVPLAAAAAVVVVSPELVLGERDNPMENRTKGLDHPTLAVHRRVAGGDPEALSSGDVAQAGDVLQLSYRSGGATHGVIVSVDGNGTVSLHHPESVAGDTSLTAGGFVELPHGYALDDAPRYERFFFVTDDAPVDARAVLRAAQALPPGKAASTPLTLAEGLEQTSFLVRKGER